MRTTATLFAEDITRELVERHPEISGLFLTVNVEQGSQLRRWKRGDHRKGEDHIQ